MQVKFSATLSLGLGSSFLKMQVCIRSESATVDSACTSLVSNVSFYLYTFTRLYRIHAKIWRLKLEMICKPMHLAGYKSGSESLWVSLQHSPWWVSLDWTVTRCANTSHQGWTFPILKGCFTPSCVQTYSRRVGPPDLPWEVSTCSSGRKSILSSKKNECRNQ